MNVGSKFMTGEREQASHSLIFSEKCTLNITTTLILVEYHRHLVEVDWTAVATTLLLLWLCWNCCKLAMNCCQDCSFRLRRLFPHSAFLSFVLPPSCKFQLRGPNSWKKNCYATTTRAKATSLLIIPHLDQKLALILIFFLKKEWTNFHLNFKRRLYKWYCCFL